ncbi:MAG: class I SAM-dependent methyltransferase [Acidobacteria bacterium]|jgi:SAM-dependent methyltransferase|nr:MAG: class I SAM-dependent methyltransferase [Acidobacteriota bacterium]
MSRPQNKLRMGYFPLPEAEAQRIRRHLVYGDADFCALDPCAGEGQALATITAGAAGHRYGIELDANRAEQARTRTDQLIYGSCFDVDCRAESFSLLYENPPYDDAMRDEGTAQRLEELFLQHTYRWLKPGGVLILVIPVSQLAVCGNILSVQFKDIEVFRLSEPESARYKQTVVFGVRRSRRERERLQEREISWWRLEFGRKSRNPDALPVLTDRPDRLYPVPEAAPIELVHRGLPVDEIEDLLPKSPAYRQARRILFAAESHERGRPVTPLHQGHVAICAVSGMLDGIFGEGDLRHLACWQAVKTILRLEEEDDEGVTTIREKEQFSHCLNLLFMDGRTAVLTADAPTGEDDNAACNQTASTQAIADAAVTGTADVPRAVRKFRLEEVRDEERA